MKKMMTAKMIWKEKENKELVKEEMNFLESKELFIDIAGDKQKNENCNQEEQEDGEEKKSRSDKKLRRQCKVKHRECCMSFSKKGGTSAVKKGRRSNEEEG